MKQKNSGTRALAITGLMAALVLLGTWIFKIPSPFGGYAHLGDCFILLGVSILGTRKGIVAAAIGASLADLLGGYAIWAGPTAVIKGLFAALMGLFMYKLLKHSTFGWIVGAVLGGIVQIALYTLVKLPLYGEYSALAELPMEIGQTVIGVILGSLLILILQKSSMLLRLRRLAGEC